MPCYPKTATGTGVCWQDREQGRYLLHLWSISYVPGAVLIALCIFFSLNPNTAVSGMVLSPFHRREN